MIQRGKIESAIWHLPDGPAQQQRDVFIKNNSIWTRKGWDGKHVDEPPEGECNPLKEAYRQGFDVFDY
jgi:hypothetical protein